MTRCYEYYCLFERKPEKCKLSERGAKYVRKYVKFLKKKGVKFDGQPSDKGLFYANFEKFGSEFRVTQVQELAHFQPQLYNVWNFNGCNPNFGADEFEGRIPGQLVQNVLHYFSEEGDVVVDPMAGSGTTYDVCLAMNRKPLCYDLKPRRKEIIEHDIRNGYPPEARNCDLILLDPPYFNMVFEIYRTKEDFYTFLDMLASFSYDTVKKNGIVAFLMQDMTEKGNYCLSGDGYFMFRNHGFGYVAHVSCPLSTEQFLPQQVEKAKKEHRMLGRNRDLYVFRRA